MFAALEALGCKFDTLAEPRKQAKAIVAEKPKKTTKKAAKKDEEKPADAE